MTLKQFCIESGLIEATELEKVTFLAFFYHETAGVVEFTMPDMHAWFDAVPLSRPNPSRLAAKMRASRSFVRGKASGSFRLHISLLNQLQTRFPALGAASEEIRTESTILPHALYHGTRGFIELLAKQINASYEHNIFDGCAVLMRRLLEVLLILSYEHLGIAKTIEDANQNYRPLEKIVSDAKDNAILKLSRDSRDLVDEFRKIGNFSAHKIYYNCRRDDLAGIIRSYRATIEELLYKAGIRT